MRLTDKPAAFAAATDGEIYNPAYNGGAWMCEAVETAETIEHFIAASRDWHISGLRKTGTFKGLPYVCWPNMQPREKAPPRAEH